MIGGIGDIRGAASAADDMTMEQLADILRKPPGGQIPQFVALAAMQQKQRERALQGGAPQPPGSVKDTMLARVAGSSMPGGGLKDMARSMAPPTAYAADGMYPVGSRSRRYGGPQRSPSLTTDVQSIRDLMRGGGGAVPDDDMFAGRSGEELLGIASRGQSLIDGGYFRDLNPSPEPYTPGGSRGRRERRGQPRYPQTTGDFLKWEDFTMPPVDDTFGGGRSDGEGASGGIADALDVAAMTDVEREDPNYWLALAAAGAKLASGNPNDVDDAFTAGIEGIYRERDRRNERYDADRANAIREAELRLMQDDINARLQVAAIGAAGKDAPALSDLYARLELVEGYLSDTASLTPMAVEALAREADALRARINALAGLATVGSGDDTLDMRAGA